MFVFLIIAEIVTFIWLTTDFFGKKLALYVGTWFPSGKRPPSLTIEAMRNGVTTLLVIEALVIIFFAAKMGLLPK